MNNNRYNSIQALRFFAALSILLYHTGFFSVKLLSKENTLLNFFDNVIFSYSVILFFVISGFVLTHATRNKTNALEFLILRILRIYIPFLLAVAIVISVKLFIFNSVPLDNILKALTLFPFGNISYPLGVEWTLVYEVFFYFIFFMILLFSFRNRIYLFGLVWFLIILFFLLMKPGWATQFLPGIKTIFFSAFNFAFIIGIFAYFYHNKFEKNRLFIALISLLLFIYSINEKNTEWKILGISLAFGFLVSLISNIAIKSDLPSNSILAKLGDTSYGVYLIHVPVITFLLSKISSLSLTQKYSGITFMLVALIALTIGILFGSFEFKLYASIKNKFKKYFRR